MTREEVISGIKFNKDTVYDYAISFIGPDGYIISVVKSSYSATYKQMEDTLVNRVLERYNKEGMLGKTN